MTYLHRDISEMETKLSIIREARALFGDDYARGLWSRLQMPDPVAPRPPYKSPIAGFIAAMIVRDRSSETLGSDLYKAYAEWMGDKPETAILHPVGFGRAMHRSGVRSRRDTMGTIYKGVRIKTPAPPSEALATVNNARVSKAKRRSGSSESG